MSDPTIVCPQCRREIKLNESLAAPLLESTRREFQSRLAAKDAEVAARAVALQAEAEQLAAGRASLDEQVRQRTAAERERIAADEGRKAKLAASVDLEQKQREVAELQAVLAGRDQKLKEAQDAQAELIRTKRELDDQRRALDLTVETRVQGSLDQARAQAKVEAEQKLAAVVAESQRATAAMETQLADVAGREAAIELAKAAVAQEREAAKRQAAEQLATDRAAIAAEEANRLRQAMATEMGARAAELAEVQAAFAAQEAKLADAQRAQAESLRKQRELDEQKRELDLTIERRVGESLSAAYDKAKRDVEDAINLKLAEKDLTIKTMQGQIEELKRTGEQASQQVQGEVLELLLEQQLGARFPHDLMEPVAKGEHGGDLLHRVHLPTGVRCGSILWETKRTKHWSDTWLAKLREDQQAARAETAVIVSFALPKGVDAFDQLDGIWVIHPRAVLPMAMALRQAMIEVHTVRQASVGQTTKMELIYQYLTGPAFRLRMEAIVSSFDDMRDDLARERKAITKQWAKRESQIDRLMAAATGMYGEMQGIAGSSLPELPGLSLLEAGEAD